MGFPCHKETIKSVHYVFQDTSWTCKYPIPRDCSLQYMEGCWYSSSPSIRMLWPAEEPPFWRMVRSELSVLNVFYRHHFLLSFRSYGRQDIHDALWTVLTKIRTKLSWKCDNFSAGITAHLEVSWIKSSHNAMTFWPFNFNLMDHPTHERGVF